MCTCMWWIWKWEYAYTEFSYLILHNLLLAAASDGNVNSIIIMHICSLSPLSVFHSVLFTFNVSVWRHGSTRGASGHSALLNLTKYLLKWTSHPLMNRGLAASPAAKGEAKETGCLQWLAGDQDWHWQRKWWDHSGLGLGGEGSTDTGGAGTMDSGHSGVGTDTGGSMDPWGILDLSAEQTGPTADWGCNSAGWGPSRLLGRTGFCVCVGHSAS